MSNNILARLNEVNDVPVFDVFGDEFKTYGRVICGYDFSDVCKYMKEKTEIPQSGNIYVASDDGLESFALSHELSASLYGGAEIQIGYCNGMNTTYNGFEFHKCSEVNFAVTDFMLVLGHVWDINDNTYDIKNARVFYVPQNTTIEMFQTTLHLSPCRTGNEGFRAVVVLTRGTNTPLEKKPVCKDEESKLLLQKNKWVIAHPQRMQLIKQGAFAGVIGENKELFY